MFTDRHEPQRCRRLETERSRIRREQPGQIRSVVTEEWRAMLLCIGACGHDSAIGKDHVETEQRIRRRAIARRAPENTILRHTATDGCMDTGERAPERRR